MRLVCKYYFFVFTVCLSVFSLSCGIERLIYFEKPRRTYDTSDLEDISRRYCAFTTADSVNTVNAAGYFQGTEIYYRIYEHGRDCTSDQSTINRYNEDNPANAAHYLQDSKKYYRLSTSKTNRRPLIRAAAADMSVRFRLQDYGDSTDPAQLTIAGALLGIPYRNAGLLSTKRRFDHMSISTDDDDVQKTSWTDSDAFWWVNFYAVSYGYDAAFRSIYSSLEPLGAIKLEKKS